jgi:predicted nucleotidyltransferase
MPMLPELAQAGCDHSSDRRRDKCPLARRAASASERTWPALGPGQWRALFAAIRSPPCAAADWESIASPQPRPGQDAPGGRPTLRSGSVSTVSQTERRALDGFVLALRSELGAGLLDVRLFGSRARGEGHEDSDFDVFVLVDDSAGDVRPRVFDLAIDQELAHGVVLSPFVRTRSEMAELRRLERAIALDIDRDGVPV